jgi:N-acetylglucosamine malate deacetylase 1
MRQCILVIGAHPDDCEIGVAGTIASYVRRGHRVVAVNLRIPSGRGEDEGNGGKMRRQLEGEKAAAILGAESVTFNLSRDDIHANVKLVSAIDKLLADFQPTTVFTHWHGDSHPEHVATVRAVLAATRRNRCSVYMYEVTLPGGITPEAFLPQRFIDISETIDIKMAALACHETQLEMYGETWIEAIKGRAAFRGFQLGCRYAEAFQVVKDVTPIPDLRHR